MVDLRQVSWLKYVIVLIVAVIAGYVLPPSTWADSPGRVWLPPAAVAGASELLRSSGGLLTR